MNQLNTLYLTELWHLFIFFQDSDDLSLKSKLLSALARELEGHSVPNSMLHTMSTLDKVKGWS